MPSRLELKFHDAMLTIYKRAKEEADYPAQRFIGMVSEQGGLATAKYLLNTPHVSDGYTALWQRGRLDLTVERVILEPEWLPLFTSEERKIAIQRLRDYGYTDALPDPESD